MTTFLRFVVLIPHREIVARISKYRCVCAAVGSPDVFSFPVAAPLALLRRPLERIELKQAAETLRAWTLCNGRRGKIPPGMFRTISLPWHIVYGQELVLPGLDIPANAVIQRFPPTLCYTAHSSGLTGKTVSEPVMEPLSTCAFANMVIRPLSYPSSFEWKTGRPLWLSNSKFGNKHLKKNDTSCTARHSTCN
ncbi:MAG: hypothetical protein LBD22_04540 [Spirochaetaceae bacterium]|jgi:hypothetical protein|nr:hypothetical protein [Spirochaetaceae bacterium]